MNRPNENHPWHAPSDLPADHLPWYFPIEDWRYVDQQTDTRGDELLVKHARQTTLTAARPIPHYPSELEPEDMLDCAIERERNRRRNGSWPELERLREKKRRAAERNDHRDWWGTERARWQVAYAHAYNDHLPGRTISVYVPSDEADAQAFYDRIRENAA